MQCSIILHSQNEKQKKGKANAKTHFRTYQKKILIQGCHKKKSTNGSEIVSSKIINSIIIEQILKTKKSKIYMLKLLK
jgi:hypothetical protein